MALSHILCRGSIEGEWRNGRRAGLRSRCRKTCEFESRLAHQSAELPSRMRRYRFTVHVRAPREPVFDLWLDLDRASEWIEGLTRITDITGPPDQAGTRYVAWFGRMRSPSEVLEVTRPSMVRTKFGSAILRGETRVTFESENGGTRLTQEFVTQGFIPAIAARIFSIGSYKGSFRGELNSFARIAEQGARSNPPDA
jgi:uncharacterized protein YndB with AHSA1/START domain